MVFEKKTPAPPVSANGGNARSSAGMNHDVFTPPGCENVPGKPDRRSSRAPKAAVSCGRVAVAFPQWHVRSSPSTAGRDVTGEQAGYVAAYSSASCLQAQSNGQFSKRAIHFTIELCESRVVILHNGGRPSPWLPIGCSMQRHRGVQRQLTRVPNIHLYSLLSLTLPLHSALKLLQPLITHRPSRTKLLAN